MYTGFKCLWRLLGKHAAKASSSEQSPVKYSPAWYIAPAQTVYL